MYKKTFYILFFALLATLSVYAESWKFIVAGDTRGPSKSNQINTEIASEIAAAIVEEKPDLAFFAGDLIFGKPAKPSHFQSWTNIFAPAYKAGIPIYPLRGNHDLGKGWKETFGKQIPDNGPENQLDLTFSVTNKNALFICIDQYSHNKKQAGINHSWLESELKNKKKTHIFVLAHEPLFGITGRNLMQKEPLERDRFLRVMIDAGVKAYFCGHDHTFNHVIIIDKNDPAKILHQVISGASGAPLHSNKDLTGRKELNWDIVTKHSEKQFGYAVIEIKDSKATLTWKHRESAGVYKPFCSFTLD
ncbi:metallophosphoesterase family protein [Verrucomicrobiota bacterium]